MKILEKQTIVKTPETTINRLKILAPLIAKKAKPGQFVVVMVDAKGERIPLTIVEKDLSSGAITIIAQEVGFTTKLLGNLNVGDSVYALVGPLGHPTAIKNYGRVIIIGGGVGIAEILPVAEALKKEGNYLTTILGARTKELLILEDRLKPVSDELYIVTDDGSYGRKGLVTDILLELLNQHSCKKYALVYAVGPIPMMRKVCEVTQGFKIETIVSLNALMVDATGMCGCCRVKIAGEVKFSCVDGPEFDGHLVDWDELAKRTKAYLEKEKHICKLKL